MLALQSDLESLARDVESGRTPVFPDDPVDPKHLFSPSANMSHVDFTKAIPGLSLRDQDVQQCTLKSSNFDGFLFDSVTFQNSNLRFASLLSVIAQRLTMIAVDASWSRWRKSRFENCQLLKSRFVGADLRGCSFADCDLSGTLFVGAWAVEADFTGADLSDCSFVSANLAGAKFVDAKFRNTLFCYAKDLDALQFSEHRFFSQTSWDEDLRGTANFAGAKFAHRQPRSHAPRQAIPLRGFLQHLHYRIGRSFLDESGRVSRALATPKVI